MATLEARIVALEGGNRGPCLACELTAIDRPKGEPRPPCAHRPTTLAQELAGMPTDNEAPDARPVADRRTEPPTR